MILELRQRKRGRRWEESNGELCGFGMSEAILEAGNDLVVPSLNRTRYCGEILGSIEMSATVPERGISSLLEFGSSIRVPGGYGLLLDMVSLWWSKTKRPLLQIIVG